MTQEKLELSFEKEKLEALRRYMAGRENETGVEEALKAHLQKLYEKTVPAPVQEYIDGRPAEKAAPKRPRRTQPRAAAPGSEDAGQVG